MKGDKILMLNYQRDQTGKVKPPCEHPPNINVYKPSNRSYTTHNFVLDEGEYDPKKVFLSIKEIYL